MSIKMPSTKHDFIYFSGESAVNGYTVTLQKFTVGLCFFLFPVIYNNILPSITFLVYPSDRSL